MEVNNSLPKGSILKGSSYIYQIENTLGQGSFGITYLASVKMAGALGAIDANIKVAIKEFFMRDINGRSDATVTSGSKGGIYDDYKSKFTREAVNLSKLQHPNIIKVIESFEANNTVYYVMEYIDGGSLDDYIAKNNGLKEEEAIEIVKQIGSALSFMHKNKMLHLDLKPSNIMRKESGDVLLIDFGLSKQYDEKGEPESSTKVGAGTPGYAPIEQASYRDGKGFPVTMDVYALGGTLFKMLTGVRPPEASDILNDGFPLYELQKLKISERTSASVAKAMSPVKKDRYQTVEDFLNSFEEEVIVIDAEGGGKKKEGGIRNNTPNLYSVPPSTKKVEIAFLPTVPTAGMYNATIKKNEVHIISGDRKSSWTLSRKAFTKFLTSLSALNLTVRDKVNPESLEASEEADKLTITLYDDNNSVYAKYWIGGWNNQFGNIIGDTLLINEKVKQIIPHLEDFLNSFSGNEKKKEKEKVIGSDKVKKFLQINSETSKVRIEYWPYSLFPPRYNGAFITTITPYEVNPNVTQESAHEMIPMSQDKYRDFLDALQALKLEIREEAAEPTNPVSFSPAKLKISLFNKEGVIYDNLWIDGMNGGNIVGNVDTLEKQIIQIVPGLNEYLNGPFYEVPVLIKEEIKTISSGPEKHKSNIEGKGNISYRWWALLFLVAEIFFAWFMLTQSQEGDLDSDGRVLRVIFVIVSICVFLFLIYVRKEIGAKTWRTLFIGSTIAYLANSMMLPMWNQSLTGAYFALSIGLAFVSSLTLLIKKAA